MSEPTLSAQRLIRSRLTSHAGLSGVPVVDMHGLPARFPAITIGTGTANLDKLTNAFVMYEAYLDIHVWAKEHSVAGAKAIGGEVMRALRLTSGKGELVDGFYVTLIFETSTYLRDPGGEHSHGILTYRALIDEKVE